MASEQQLKMYNDMIDRGCCKRCILRYLDVDKIFVSFEHPNTTFVNFGYLSPMEEFETDPPNKKHKSSPCCVCLDLFEDVTLEEMLAHEDLSKTSEYQHTTFGVYITFPVCVKARDHSMKLYLKWTYPDVFNEKSVTKVEHTFRECIGRRLSKVVGKKFESVSKFNIHFHVNYDLDKEELQLLAGDKPTLSRHQAQALLHNISDEEFKKLVSVPPRIPFYGVTFKELTVFAEAISIVGSYWKFSRDLCQSVSENSESIEGFIIQAIKQVVGDCQEITFTASGYDQKHVRLFDARSFQVQMDNPKFDSVPRSVCQKIEQLLRRHKKDIKVAHLRQADKRDIALLFNNEQYSPRLYRVLCIAENCKSINHAINAINMYSKIHVKQQTPIRNLHQRPLHMRKFRVYHIRAQSLGDNLLQLDVCADVGLQIPEFVNGDMGRTIPSVSEITNANIGFVAIDILKFQATLACAEDEENLII